MKKAALIFVAIVSVIFGSLYSLTFIDVNEYRGELSKLAEERTGRKLDLAGPLEVGFSLTPTIVARDVRFGNAPWGSKPFMLEAEEVEVSLSLFALLTGRVDVSSVSAENSVLLLEADAQGRANWELGNQREAEGAETSADEDVSLPDIDLINTRITYKSSRIDQVYEADLAHLSVVDGLLGIDLDIEGSLNGQTVSIVGNFSGSPSSFAVTDFRMKLGEMVFEGSGSAERPELNAPFHVVAQVTANRADLTPWMDIELTENPSADAETSLLDRPLDMSFLDIVTADLEVKVDRLRARDVEVRRVNAKIMTMTDRAALDIETSYDAKQVRLVAQIERGKTLSGKASLKFDEFDIGKLAEDADVEFDMAAIASGNGSVSARGNTLRALLASATGDINGMLLFEELDFTPLSGPEGTDESEGTDTDQALFSQEELPLTFVDGFTGKIDIEVEKLVFGDVIVSDITMPISFEGKEINSSLSAHYHDREIKLNHAASLSGRPTFTMDLIADDFDLGGLLSELGVTKLARVRADLAVKGTAAGNTPKALASSFSGAMNLVTGEGEIASSLFELIATDLVWALVPKGSDGGRAKLTCVVNRIDFVEGVGTVSAFALVTQRMRTSGGGTVDLRDESLDLTFYPKPNDTSLLSLSTPLRVTGSMVDPSVRPDTASFLLDAAKIVGAGIFTGGIGAVLPLMNLQSFDAEDADACLTMIGDGAGPGGVNGTIGSGAGVVKDGAGAVVEGVGDILTAPFK